MLMTMKLLSVEALWRHHLTLRLQDSHIFTHWRQRETIRECCDDDGKDPYQCRQLCMHQSATCLIIFISHHYLMCGEPPHSLHMRHHLGDDHRRTVTRQFFFLRDRFQTRQCYIRCIRGRPEMDCARSASSRDLGQITNHPMTDSAM